MSKLKDIRSTQGWNDPQNTLFNQTMFSPMRNSKIPTSILIPLEPIAENRTPISLKKKLEFVSPFLTKNKRNKFKKVALSSLNVNKEIKKHRRPKRHQSNAPTLSRLF